MSKAPRPKLKSAPVPNQPLEEVELDHCPPGDPCERIIEIRPDGVVWVNALCGEIIPVLKTLCVR